jgi:hypothetical protein
MREVDAQRQLDLASIGQGMTRLENSSGVTNAAVRRLLVRAATFDTK